MIKIAIGRKQAPRIVLFLTTRVMIPNVASKCSFSYGGASPVWTGSEIVDGIISDQGNRLLDVFGPVKQKPLSTNAHKQNRVSNTLLFYSFLEPLPFLVVPGRHTQMPNSIDIAFWSNPCIVRVNCMVPSESFVPVWIWYTQSLLLFSKNDFLKLPKVGSFRSQNE